MRSQLGETEAARAAFTQAASIIDSIGAGIDDERLRSVFLNSEAIREVLKNVVR